MKNETIKPCPFCGSDAEITQRIAGLLCDLGCSDQNCTGYQLILMLPSDDDIDDCIAAWNRRPPLPANVVDAVGHLEQFVEFIEGNSESSRLSKSCFRTILEHLKPKEQTDG